MRYQRKQLNHLISQYTKRLKNSTMVLHSIIYILYALRSACAIAPIPIKQPAPTAFDAFTPFDILAINPLEENVLDLPQFLSEYFLNSHYQQTETFYSSTTTSVSVAAPSQAALSQQRAMDYVSRCNKFLDFVKSRYFQLYAPGQTIWQTPNTRRSHPCQSHCKHKTAHDPN